MLHAAYKPLPPFGCGGSHIKIVKETVLISLDIDFYRRLAKGLVQQFGDRCEILMIQTKPVKDFDEAILFIENPCITKSHCIPDKHRSDGKGLVQTPAFLAWQALLKHSAKALSPEELCVPETKDIFGQTARTDDGKIIKYSLMYLCDTETPGQIAAILAVHWDITALVSAQGMLGSLVGSSSRPQTPSAPDCNVEEFLEKLIFQAESHIGKPAAAMDRQEKIRAICFLNDAGAFLIQKSGDRISKHFGISKYTLYSYIDAGKSYG